MGPAGSDAAEARAPRPLAVDGGGAQHKTNSRGPRRGLGAQVPRRRGGEAGRGQTPSRGDGITAGFCRNGALLRWGGAGAEAEAERAARLSAGAARRGAVPGRPRPPLRRGRAAARGPCDAAAAGGPAAGHGRGGRVRSCAGAGGQRWAGPCGEVLLMQAEAHRASSCCTSSRMLASLWASMMFPWILSFPLMNACMPSSFPLASANISATASVIVTSGFSC
ncbi:unnamed protein product [Prorocentrum cordatum]|uniref:Uncharacterized protein n=1 Tax=Prorocentrum cordatum TaxID=2364126 RepID=A0ABN9TXV3_9DINO|nr:unnamed protein product [Polarella glacialis]